MNIKTISWTFNDKQYDINVNYDKYWFGLYDVEIMDILIELNTILFQKDIKTELGYGFFISNNLIKFGNLESNNIVFDLNDRDTYFEISNENQFKDFLIKWFYNNISN